MELYKLKRGDKFKLIADPTIPPCSRHGESGVVYRLTNIDGMYSHVTDSDGDVYHFAAWTDVEKVNEE